MVLENIARGIRQEKSVRGVKIEKRQMVIIANYEDSRESTKY